MFADITEVLKTFEIFGINIILVAMTAGFVSAVKKVTAAAKIPVPTWVWLAVVMIAGFIIALFEALTVMDWITAGIKNATAASYAYDVWSKIQKKLQPEKDGENG